MFAFYLSDNIKLLQIDELLLCQTLSCAWTAQFYAIPFVFGRREMHVTNILFPFSAAIKTRWLTDAPLSPAKLRRAKRELFILNARLFPYKLIGSAALLILFVVGPTQTLRFGFLTAILSISLPYLSLLVLLTFFLAADRRYFELSWWKCAQLTLELLVCPGYVANIARRLSLYKTHSEFDGVGYCLVNSSLGEVERLRASVDLRLSDIIEQHEGDTEDLSRLHSYRDALG
jgi:hypothetical protein